MKYLAIGISLILHYRLSMLVDYIGSFIHWGFFVQRIVEAKFEKRIEQLTLRERSA